MLFYGKSDIGMKRTVNQDNFNTCVIGEGPLVAVVCDGMGGSAGGSIASAVAMDVFMTGITKSLTKLENETESEHAVVIPRVLRDAVLSANSFLYKISQHDNSLNGMGTTLVAAIVYENRLFCANVGDSRMYRINRRGIVQITHDHSLVQYLVDIGKMTAKEALTSSKKNIITRAVGVAEKLDCDIFSIDLDYNGDDYYLLCSDGLTNQVNDEEILDTVLDKTLPDLAKKTDYLIDRANINGGTDNITAVLIKI